jgi:septal ring factor EnvC (AmiA/AmiB activator)
MKEKVIGQKEEVIGSKDQEIIALMKELEETKKVAETATGAFVEIETHKTLIEDQLKEISDLKQKLKEAVHENDDL